MGKTFIEFPPPMVTNPTEIATPKMRSPIVARKAAAQLYVQLILLIAATLIKLNVDCVATPMQAR